MKKEIVKILNNDKTKFINNKIWYCNYSREHFNIMNNFPGKKQILSDDVDHDKPMVSFKDISNIKSIWEKLDNSSFHDPISSHFFEKPLKFVLVVWIKNTMSYH